MRSADPRELALQNVEAAETWARRAELVAGGGELVAETPTFGPGAWASRSEG